MCLFIRISDGGLSRVTHITLTLTYTATDFLSINVHMECAPTPGLITILILMLTVAESAEVYHRAIYFYSFFLVVVVGWVPGAPDKFILLSSGTYHVSTVPE